jgi:Glycosyl transferase 4-like domain
MESGHWSMCRVASESRSAVSSPNDRHRAAFYLVDWLPPDFGAVGQYAVLFAREMARTGSQVRLIGLSSQPRTTDREEFGSGGSLEIRRLCIKRFDKSKPSSRLLWAATSNLRLVWEVVRDKNAYRADLLFTGSPPFMLFFAYLARWLRKTRLIYRITDFYPEVLFAAWGRRPALLAIFERATWCLRRGVDEFQVLGEDQRGLLLAGGVQPERIVLKRDICPVALTGTDRPAPLPRGLEGRKVLLYSGNLGVAHEVETVVKGLAWHYSSGSGRFALWLNASGSGVEPLINGLKAAGIPVALTEPVPLEELPSLFASADAHLVTLKTSFSGYVVPSKIYACLASRRPIVFVGPKSSDVHLLCSREQSLRYEHVNAGDAEGFSGALERLASVEKEASYV